MTRRVRRYGGLAAAAVLLVAVGVASGTPALLLAGVVPLAFVVHGALSTLAPLDDRVRVERELRPEAPLPGQSVEVTLTATNVGASVLPDLRMRDGVPEELSVRDGASSVGTALRPGESATATYTLTANRGRYAFRPVRLRASTVSGTVVAETTREADGADGFECRIDAADVPLRRRTTAFSGSLATDTGGVGVEFHATRDYRAGDPVNRINWRRYAKTGELSTVEYREQRAARVAVLIDAREPSHVAGAASLPTGATLCAYAATLATRVLRDDGHHVGVGAFGVADPLTDRRPAWVPPDADAFATHAAAVCNAAATGSGESVTATAAEDARADGGGADCRRLLAGLPATAQVIHCTPALDDAAASTVESIRAHGHETTVLSPSVPPNSVGGRVLALERAVRLDRMRGVGAAVVDWDREEELPVALGRVLRGGSYR
ncbi:DUF58 domain-containing protein [Haloplanus rubicundus]|uniref:DUF58 domain-containing protein n=1 Tax=Haloplanus rubicundus TaxID=1547898 RepID=UPI00165738B9|nr:DUF58 domain-containing protein [Haloplanus rubicundus]